MESANTELLLRTNGIQAAFGIEFGFASPRADEGRQVGPYRQANVSYSLLQQRDGQVVRHTLIDVGMGVMPSLLDFEVTHGVHVVHEVLITHPHFDHFAQLDWLSMALLRKTAGRISPDRCRSTPRGRVGKRGRMRSTATWPNAAIPAPLSPAALSRWETWCSRPLPWTTVRRRPARWGS